MNKLLSKLRAFFLVHPDEVAKSEDGPAREGFARFLLKDASGIALIAFLVLSVAWFIAMFLASVVPLAIVAAVCVYVVIRAIGLHHANWRRRLLDEAPPDGYRVDGAHELRHAHVPHFARIALTITIVLFGALVGGQVIDAVGRIASSPEPEPAFLPDMDAGADSSRAELEHRIGEPCHLGTGDCEAGGTWTVSGDALMCGAIVHVPTSEVCDNRDNDCDGSVDEDLRRYAGVPPFLIESSECIRGGWVSAHPD